MDKNSLAQLIEISHAVGANREYVQAAGGNTSVKSPDGRTMAIKASGTALTLMSETDGWVEMDVAAVLSVLDRTDLAALPVKEREARVLECLHAAAVGGRGRPSVETALHAMLGRVVVHTHAVAANALNCGPGLAALAEICPPGELPPLWVPYTDPGWCLATAVRTAAEAYRQQHGSAPAVIFMENHGLLVAGSGRRRVPGAPRRMGGAVRAVFRAGWRRRSRPAPEIGSAALRKTMVELRRVWREAFGARPFVRFSGDKELAGAACSEAADIFAAGSLTPDHIVYTGAHAVVAESLDELPAKLRPALAEKSFPRRGISQKCRSVRAGCRPRQA